MMIQEGWPMTQDSPEGSVVGILTSGVHLMEDGGSGMLGEYCVHGII